ncbi:PLDc N-terminal domain-containing protein [Nocardia asteroides]|uniref:PLDc N-terminal domain-containing protein n=1 Tax=Nocardia asteroides TaxID=1824 RepID=UPI001E485F3D|nr:PLDc N-terminal domain-containing protein [Nocardia asteroides]UGT61961.1 PLDc N-terminal domain-containing protein [Nocardia asteroides]
MWDSFWDFLWAGVVIFAFVAYLMILFNILVDLFWRDHKTSGAIKAVWLIGLIVLPYLTALVYLIARGRGMAERAREYAASTKQETDAYIREAAGRSPAQEIAHAKELLDAGTITTQEFEALKVKALSHA